MMYFPKSKDCYELSNQLMQNRVDLIHIQEDISKSLREADWANLKHIQYNLPCNVKPSPYGSSYPRIKDYISSNLPHSYVTEIIKSLHKSGWKANYYPATDLSSARFEIWIGKKKKFVDLMPNNGTPFKCPWGFFIGACLVTVALPISTIGTPICIPVFFTLTALGAWCVLLFAKWE